MTAMDMSKYRDLFLSEAREHLQGMSTCLLTLEKDPSASDSIDELFRHAHSLKGMSASMGFGPMAELAHRMEDMMDSIRKGRASFSRPFMDLLFSGMDSLEGMVGVVEAGRSLDEMDISELVAHCLAAADGKPVGPPAASPPPPSPSPSPAEIPVPSPVPSDSAPDGEGAAADGSVPQGLEVRFHLATDCQVPAARGYLTVKKLGEMGTILSLDPTLEVIRAGRAIGGVRVILSGADPGRVRDMLLGLPEMGEVIVAAPGSSPPPGGEAYVADPVLQGADLSPLPSAAPPGGGASASAKAAADKMAGKPAPPPTPHATAPKTVRIHVDLLDTFINLVGELIVTRSRLKGLLAGNPEHAVGEALSRLDQLIGTLHGEVMKVRMMPLETVTARLPRVARDLAHSRGKDADLAIEGSEIELDRAILEELGDPLIHILRNAVDHGIEDSEGRKKAGKKPQGQITIRAYRERDMVHIEVSDDGRGIDIARIRRKAVEKGIIDAGQAKALTEEEAIMLVCRPGFSTLDQVTDVSGRGVGMDVVRSTVESLGGNLVIRSRAGQGTSFLLKLPLTVAIVRMLLVGVSGHPFAIPITRVLRTVRVEHTDIQQSQHKRYLTLGEELVPLHDTRALLAISGDFPRRGTLTVVLVEAVNRSAGLLVDEILGQEDVVVKPMCYPLELLSLYSGMTVLGDGRVVPILDLKNLLS